MSVSWQNDGTIFKVIVDRPDALNAVDFDVMSKLETALEEAEGSTDLRVFCLRGAGTRSFISGGDLKAFSALATAEEGADMARRMLGILERIESLPALTVAGVNGPAYGGGTETALAFDIRIAARHATFGFTQGRFAVPPGWGGLTRMVELVGKSRTLHWLATSAIVEADTALRCGLVNVVAAEFDADLSRQLRKMARNDCAMIDTLKSGVRRLDSKARNAAIEAELEPFADHWGSDLHHERVDAFLNKE